MKALIELITILIFNLLSIVFTILLIHHNTYTMGLKIGHIIRTILFTYLSVYLYLNPSKLNFFGKSGDLQSVSNNPGNAIFSKVLAQLFSFVGMSISFVLYMEW